MNMSFESTDINTKFCPLISASITVPYNPTEKMQLATIFSIAINCIMWPVGISANVLAFITVLRKPQLRTVYNTSVLWLIAGDLCVILLAQTSNIVYLVNKFTTGDYSCSLFFVYNLFTWWCHGLSFFTLLFISIERYFAVFWSFKYEEVVTKQRVSGVVVLSWMLWSAIVLILHLIPDVPNTIRAIIIISFVLPSSVLTLVIYCKIFRQIRGNIVHVGLPEYRPSPMNQDRKLSKTIGLIIGVQIASFLPSFSLSIVQAFSLFRKDLLIHGIFPFTESAAFMNALLDPMIYFWRSTEARRSFKELSCSCLCSQCTFRSTKAQETSVYVLQLRTFGESVVAHQPSTGQSSEFQG